MQQNFNIVTGKEGRVDRLVDYRYTAKTFASGSLDILATPYMIALMEEAATCAVELPEGYTTVGTRLEVDHVSATPIGMKVYATAKVTGVDGRKIFYDLEAYDEKGMIGKGTHERFIVEAERFLNKAYDKLG